MRYVYLILIILSIPLFADENSTGQEVIEKLDNTLLLKDGHTKAKLSIKKGNHETHSWLVNIFKQKDDVLYTFEVTHRKPIAKFLSVKRGQKLIYYNIRSGKIFRIEQMEKLASILHTSFSYLDFSNYQYEANYKPEKANSENTELRTIKLLPISFPSYKYLLLHADNTDNTPKRLDFTSTDGLLIKTLRFKYGNIKLREGKNVSELPSLKEIIMTDNSTNFKSILEIMEWNKNIKPERIFYEIKYLYEK